MFFRNVTLFVFSRKLDLSSIEDGVKECTLTPVGPYDLTSRGFVSPYGRDHAQMVGRFANIFWLAIGAENRVLPASAVNDLVAKKVAAIEKHEGCRINPRRRRRIRDEVFSELLPRALVNPSRTDAIINPHYGFVAIDTASKRVAESVVSEIRRALGSFPALPLNAEVAPRAVLTGWVAGDPLPEGLALGDECELRDPADKGAVVKCQRHELQGDEIQRHLEAGKQVTRLALTFDNHVSFVLGEDLVIRKLKLLGGALDVIESVEREDLRAELDARFALMNGELASLWLLLHKSFKTTRVE